MIERMIRGLIVGLVLGICSLIGLGWKAYGEMNAMGKSVKAEVKKEMLQIRRHDMEHIQQRFNTLEILISGKVISPQKQFKDEE